MRTLTGITVLTALLTAAPIVSAQGAAPTPPPPAAQPQPDGKTAAAPAEGAKPGDPKPEDKDKKEEPKPADAKPAEPVAPIADQPAAPPIEPPPPPEPPKPATETQCQDMVDDDADGKADCADPDCASQPVCVPPPPPPAAPAAPEVMVTAPTPVASGRSLAVEGLLGLATRLDSANKGYDATGRVGVQLGVGAFYFPNRDLGFGLSYFHSQLGYEQSDAVSIDGSDKIHRSMQNLAVNVRYYPWRMPNLGAWVGLNVGLSMQSAKASGVVATGNVSRPAETYRDDLGPDGGVSLGAAAGVDYALGSNLSMLGAVAFTHHRLSSDAMNDGALHQIPGMGSSSQFDVRLGLQYRFDVVASQ